MYIRDCLLTCTSQVYVAVAEERARWLFNLGSYRHGKAMQKIDPSSCPNSLEDDQTRMSYTSALLEQSTYAKIALAQLS